MSEDSRIMELLDEVLDTQRAPEEVCADFPELLETVRERIEECRRVETQLEAMFPPSGAVPASGHRAAVTHGDGLPKIQGYEVEAILGRGGVAVVYKARQLNLNRSIALKMLLSGAFASAAELTRFRREAEAVAGLKHAHVVQVHDVGDLDGRPYFTMEFVEGGNLGQKLAGAPQAARYAAELMANLATAVDVAHKAGIVHRDLKPANILLTPDGIPKITDFGLARHLDRDHGITLTGTRVGTPSYMAPEQAIGTLAAIGPAVDIYSLGAILYEMLTGRPPFRGETAAETERQLITTDPVAPSRLNAKVPRDLETICLKCLRKDPQKRYATAAALADDLRCFLRGEPISARPMGVGEKCLRWVQKRPALAGALAGALLLACVVIGGGVWLVLQHSDRRHAVEADLKEVTDLQEQARWSAARAALERAEARLGNGGLSDLRGRLQQARHNLDLVMTLDAIRLSRVTQGDPLIYRNQANQKYEQSFVDAGFGKVHDPASGVAARIKGSAVRAALIAALDDWIVSSADMNRRAWIIEVALGADPSGWRARILDQAKFDDQAALAELARDVPIEGQPLSLLLALGERVRLAGGDASVFLKRVQRENAADFWANLTLGNALLFRVPMEAGGYYRAALASRPEAAVGYCVVGDALRLQTALDPAIHYYKKALQRDPSYARAYTNLGLCLEGKGLLDDAIANYQKAIPLDPDYSWTYFELANALRTKGLFDDAGENYRKAALLDPSNPRAYDGVRGVLIRQGHAEDVWADWKKKLAADPYDVDDWIGYGELGLFLGFEDEYRRARAEMLKRFGGVENPSVAERTSRACLLLPIAGADLQKAIILADRAVASKATASPLSYRYFQFASGLANYREGRFDATIAVMEEIAPGIGGPAPRLVLAMAQHRLGKAEDARKSLAAAVLAMNWSRSNADARDLWIWHVLRREAEGMILPNLPALLSGSDRPKDNDERIALLAPCQFNGLHATAAGLYADIFAADPEMAESQAVDHRFSAARCAALAGCGRGEEARTLSAAERTRWRAQARTWLRADLAATINRAEGGDGAGRASLRQRLSRWRAENDLAGIRDRVALDELPSGEKGECVSLWRGVASAIDRAKEPQP